MGTRFLAMSRALATSRNGGANVARNRLLESARGDWLQYLDADDYLLPDKVIRQMEFIAPNPQIDVLFGPVAIEQSSESQTWREVLPISEPHDPWILLARWFLPQTGASLWRKQAIVDVGGWKPEQPCCQEHELYLRLLMAGRTFAYCEDNGAIYRHWGETSLWRGNVPEVHRRRLEIEQRAEDFLRNTRQLTRERQHAINIARFETARIAWHYDRKFAGLIVQNIRATEPGFIPEGASAPASFRLAMQLLGFGNAERLADLRRKLFPQRPASQSVA
jgi:glycosyltransferase involved in cell wall biosynthesis